MSAGYAPCSCQQAEELTARVRELEELVETAAAELDKRDEHLSRLRRDLEEMALLAYRHEEISVGRLAELLSCSLLDAQERATRVQDQAMSELATVRQAASEASIWLNNVTLAGGPYAGDEGAASVLAMLRAALAPKATP